MNKSNWKRRAYYGATIATMIALTAGFALATVNLGQTNTSYQGSQTTTVSGVAGVTYVSTDLGVSSGVSSTTCTSGSPCTVTSSGATDCVSGTCASSDYIETITLTTTAGTAFAGTVEITVYVTAAGVTTPGATRYYLQPSGSNTAQSIVQVFDIGTVVTGPEAVTSVTVIATA